MVPGEGAAVGVTAGALGTLEGDTLAPPHSVSEVGVHGLSIDGVSPEHFLHEVQVAAVVPVACQVSTAQALMTASALLVQADIVRCPAFAEVQVPAQRVAAAVVIVMSVVFAAWNVPAAQSVQVIV